ncbi:hypothetical protein QBC43DRAFT_352113 [Cladorrhinum sp. PSN259]|nr:hypothetical protein QBC43DRAFT_352113 [Cladorrhinum sp. PSN259]
MLEGSSIAAILTGILALFGALATASMSGWNDRRIESRKNRKALARYSVPLLVAFWDLANWLYDILEDDYYSPGRCAAYGDGWSNDFTSYLFGQYFAGVHIIREMTQFFAYIHGGRAEQLKRLLWKIQDEFISMYYDGRENLELRWFEGDILAVQELMTTADSLDGEGNKKGLQTMGWLDFRRNYPVKKAEDKESKSMELQKIFFRYEKGFQRIVYRRFKYLYQTKWLNSANPQGPERMKEGLLQEVYSKRLDIDEEEKQIEAERQGNPDIVVVIPDHRVRRLQHLLSDLVRLLDEESRMKFNRPVRRCKMVVDKRVLAPNTSKEFEYKIPCDCYDRKLCNPEQKDFEHRDLTIKSGLMRKGTLKFSRSKSPPPQTDNGDQC